MVGVVLVGVVRVYAMGVVGRDQQRALDRPAEGVAFRQQAAQYLFEERTVGAAMRTGTDFSWSVQTRMQFSSPSALSRASRPAWQDSRLSRRAPAMNSSLRPTTAADWVS